VATGALVVVVGAAAACSAAAFTVAACRVQLAFVDVLAAKAAVVALVAAAALGRVIAMATAPTKPAAPAPTVMAEIRASPFLRASCRAEAEVGEPVLVL
jgi:hypothetical protein